MWFGGQPKNIMANTVFGASPGSKTHLVNSPQNRVFEVDKKFQTVFIAFVKFHDLNDVKKVPSAISTVHQLFRV